MSKIVQEIIGKNWIVYRLVNRTKKEIYFGVTKDYSNRLKEHASKETDAIKHWNFAGDSIDPNLVKDGLTQTEASELAHSLEKQIDAQFPDYKVIVTSGI